MASQYLEGREIFDLKMTDLRGLDKSDTSVPVYQIDLSLPPKQRYVVLAELYAPQIQRLTMLFDTLLEDLGIPSHQHVWIKRAARLFLRRLHSHEETEEIRGIAKTAGVSMYLLVSFNVILDLLMGCTSGAVRSLEPGQPVSQAKMLHFRTLDWGMDRLRSVIVQLDFIRSKSATPKLVIASSITYVGFVGILTGVRRDLSMSLNFRGVHNASTRLGHFQFYLHHLLVLLGMRQSIPSLLRFQLIGSMADSHPYPATLARLAERIPSKRSTAAYLIFSDGKTTVTMEKDYRTAIARRSKSFIVMTNHDLNVATNHNSTQLELASLADVLNESSHRRKCIADKWKIRVRRVEYRSKGADRLVTDIEDSVAITPEEAISWISAWPTTNECTHFAAVLDPTEGRVVWTQRYLTPVDEA